MFDFATNRTVEDMKTVPEQFQPLYKETEDGKFTLSSEPAVVGAVEAMIGLSTALTASRLEAKDYKGKQVDLSSLSDWGTEPEAIKTAIATKLDELTAEIAKGKGATLDLDSLKEALAKTHAQEIGAKDVVIEGMRGQIHKELVTNRAQAAIAKAGGNLLLLEPHLNKSIKTVANDKGEFEAQVVDKDGTRRFSGVTAEHMTIEELVAEMKTKEEFGPCFVSDAPSGGGAKPIGGAPPRLAVDKMNSVDKISAGLTKRRAGR